MPATDYTFGGHANALYDAEGRKSDIWPALFAGANPGVVPGPTYIHGTHAVALYNAEAQKTKFWGNLTPGALPRGVLTLDMSAAPQDWPYVQQGYTAKLILTQPVASAVPLRMAFSAPQVVDLTLQPQYQAATEFGTPFVPPVTPINTSCGETDIYDTYNATNGTVLVEWGAFGGPSHVDSYNVYLNGVLNQNVTVPMAVISGLIFSSYNGFVVTPAPRYYINIVSVSGGQETATSGFHPINASPTSTTLVTPMKRVFPFPNSGNT
jgi:hypothetical protein